MYEWNEAVQKMLDWIEENITENPMLSKMSAQIGYSPFYCSTQFHKITGMTIKSYAAGRRLRFVAEALRDTDERILDIAVKYGFSSQEALTRAFVNAFNRTPAAYRKNPVPITLSVRKVVLFPEYYIGEGENNMNSLCEARQRIEIIPAHKYLGIWEPRAKGYGDFWQYHNCDEVCGIIESIKNFHPIITRHTAGWVWNGGERSYFYGIGMPLDYDGVIPNGFEIKEFPESYYMQFYHPQFDYLTQNEEVMGRVEKLAWSFDPKPLGWNWNEDSCQDYQRHYPEGLGYQVLRPVKNIK